MAAHCFRLAAAVAALAPLAAAGDGGGYEVTKWMTTTCWETEKQEKSVTYYDTQWSTKYETSYIEVTAVEYKTVPTTETTTETVYSTVTDTVTLFETQTAIQVSGVTDTETAISVATETAAVTSVDLVVTTVYETITPDAAPLLTVTACPPPPTLEGLVLCPSRTSKDVQKSFPTNYLWGCPPGKICKPKQVACNFEQNVPEEGYYCDPLDGDECIDAPPLPPFTDSETNYTCGNLLEPALGYFDFDPHLFGLDFSIYNFGGQVAKPCEVPAPPASPSKSYSPQPIYSPSEWQSWSPPAPSPEVSSEWQAWSPPVVTPSPYEPAKDTEWSQWDGTAGLPASRTWGQWSEPHVTPRAILAPRQGSPLVPNICVDKCDQCVRHGQRAGFVYAQLCEPDVDFQAGYTACAACITDNKPEFPNSVPPLLPSLVQFLEWCSENPPTSTIQIEPSPTPAEPIATTSVVTSTEVVTSRPSATPTTFDSTSIVPSSPVAPSAPVVTPSSSTPTTPSVSAEPSPQGSITLITSCSCVTITSTLAAGSVPASQISDGQVQAPTGPATFTGVASSVRPAESNWFITLVLSLLALFQM